MCQPIVPPLADEINLSGPRVGFTVLSQSTVDTLKRDKLITVTPLISQFGWQFEKQFYSTQAGPTAVTECVLLLGGLDQGVVIPSLSWLAGLRTRDGAEFGIGPNIMHARQRAERLQPAPAVMAMFATARGGGGQGP
jgi:hypothetical protein